MPASTRAPTDGTLALVREESGRVGLAVFLGDRGDAGSTAVVPIGRLTRGSEMVRAIRTSLEESGRPAQSVEIRRVIRKR